MIPVVTPEQMRTIDAAASDSVETLIERAGAAVAREALRMLGGGYGRTVAVIAGPGNNGADGRTAADRLRERGVVVVVLDATACPPMLPTVDLVIDAGFGTGFRGDWKPPSVGSSLVLAVDVPTGLDGLTGRARPNTIRADVTVTFAAAKPGHVLCDGPDFVGRLVIADIGLAIDAPCAGIVEATDVAGWLPERARSAHKWDHATWIVAGRPGMKGAAWLAAAAAQRVGAGMVTLSSPGIDPSAPIEVVGKRLPEFDWAEAVLSDLHRFDSLVVGPGLGRDDQTVPSVVRVAFESTVPVVVDGDGLFALSWNEQGSPEFLRNRDGATILTPHDGEFGLLMGARPDADRIASAHRLVAASGAVVLLKGPATVIAGPGGRTYLVTNGDQRLASAGTGDVLSGIVGGLLAMGVEPIEAAAAGAWIHADAAGRGARHGLVASDIVQSIPSVLQQLNTR